MAASRISYESVFDAYLRRVRAPYITVAQFRRAVLGSASSLPHPDPPDQRPTDHPDRLKSFDFVVYGPIADRTPCPRDDQPPAHPAHPATPTHPATPHLLIEVKGRRLKARQAGDARPRRGAVDPVARLESWATLEDIGSLAAWQTLFGPPFLGVMVFLYRLDDAADARGFEEWFAHAGARYALAAYTIDDYRSAMKPRSPRWNTVDLPSRSAPRLARTLFRGPRALWPAEPQFALAPTDTDDGLLSPTPTPRTPMTIPLPRPGLMTLSDDPSHMDDRPLDPRSIQPRPIAPISSPRGVRTPRPLIFAPHPPPIIDPVAAADRVWRAVAGG